VRRVTILGKSHPAKNRNLRWLISNLSQLNWSRERNTVYCFSTVFTLTVRPREIGTGGTGLTSKHDNEAQTLFSTALSESYRMNDSSCARHTLLNFHCPSPSHYFLSDRMENITSKSLLLY
jgi:hypothetical protein